MGRTTNIVYDDFLKTAQEFESGGKKLTFSNFKNHLGIGYETWRKHLDAYEAQTRQKYTDSTISQGLASGMQSLFEQARSEALATAQAQLKTELDAAVHERQNLEATRAQLVERAARAEMQASMLHEQMQQIQAKSQIIEACNAALEGNISELRIELASLKGAIHTHEQNRIQADLGFESERKNLMVIFERTVIALAGIGETLSTVQSSMHNQFEHRYTQHLSTVESTLKSGLDRFATENEKRSLEALKIKEIFEVAVQKTDQASIALRQRLDVFDRIFLVERKNNLRRPVLQKQGVLGRKRGFKKP